MHRRFDTRPPVQGPCERPLPGIVIHGRCEERSAEPRIQAFVWGGKVPTAPVLDYGRRKGAA